MCMLQAGRLIAPAIIVIALCHFSAATRAPVFLLSCLLIYLSTIQSFLPLPFAAPILHQLYVLLVVLPLLSLTMRRNIGC